MQQLKNTANLLSLSHHGRLAALSAPVKNVDDANSF